MDNSAALGSSFGLNTPVLPSRKQDDLPAKELQNGEGRRFATIWFSSTLPVSLAEPWAAKRASLSHLSLLPTCRFAPPPSLALLSHTNK